jgi:AcrR family transcriptional regulator
MPRRLQPRSGTRETVLQAAIAVFAECGYQGATMEQIARRAGVAKGTPYLHFSDKAGLFYAVFERWTAEAMAGSAQAMEVAGDARGQLLALGLGAAEFMDNHREWFPLSLEVWAASGTPALRERFAAALGDLYAGYRHAAADIVRAGQGAGELRPDLDAEALAALLTGAVDGLFLQAWLDPGLDVRGLLRGFFDALDRGIVRPADGDPT